VLLLLYDDGKIICKCRKVRMPEKVYPASAFLLVVNCLRGQSGIAGHGIVRHFPVMVFTVVYRNWWGARATMLCQWSVQELNLLPPPPPIKIDKL
jgi:hypothetical protein